MNDVYSRLPCLLLLGLLFLSGCGRETIEPAIWREEPANADPRPDIVLVVSDDMRWDLMSARGHEVLQTPKLDALAVEGAMMMNAFVPVALCSPSRAAILTGRDVHKASAPRIVWKNNSFLQTQTTFVEELKNAGYTTAFLGKWHLGDGSKPRPEFDYWESFDWLGDFHNPVTYRNGERIAHHGYVDDILSNQANRVLYEEREPGKPMFIMLSLKAPHLQFEHTKRHASAYSDIAIAQPDTYNEDFSVSGKLLSIYAWLGIENFHCGLSCFADSWDQYIRSHYRAVLGIDDQIGVLRKAVAQGRKPDNTLFIYTSDNGYSLGDHGLTEKHVVYEEPIRVPLLMDVPGDAEAGMRPEGLVSTLDIAPTILDYAQAETPARMTGRTLKPLLENAATTVDWRSEIFLMYEKAQIAVRTDRYKLIRSLTEVSHYELYDLQLDPKEVQNVFYDPTYTAVRDDMQASLKSLVLNNQWSHRKRFPIRELWVSQAIASSDAYALAQQLSLSKLDLNSNKNGAMHWTRQLVGTEKWPDRFALKTEAIKHEGQSIMVAVPVERLVGWDPFVELVLRRRTHATVFVRGEEIFSTKRDKLPLEVSNPALIEATEQVLIVFDDSGAMDVKLELEAPEDTIRLPLENTILGDAPGRFRAVEGWQPHSAIQLNLGVTGLDVTFPVAQADVQGGGVLQNDAVHINQPVTITIEGTASASTTARLYWRSDLGQWNDSQSVVFELSAETKVQTLPINPSKPIGALQIRFDEPQQALSLQQIDIRGVQGLSLYRWEF